ncbi:ABC transporter ATP-binding protein [Paracnuella aquatica]|uniref:ABC transporter ATP-binding protein n=1 Tax=Paracnuella aquatica TaxID=2268757 RepID=UPI000DEFD8E0|nr:ABC transporter ATP-binding protein [Paracnuella aquatica]RPD46718.1 ABC transporter ATP-binding protein [Paracnuella aquatica]
MEPIISLKQVNKSYGTKQVLHDINLDIFPGQVIGYIGPNGAGKSTTVKILCGLLTDYTGQVQVAGVEVKADPLAVKKLVGYVPELADLYEVLTPWEYLEFVATLQGMEPSVYETRIQRMVEAFGLRDNLHQRMDSFSKGMRQKVLLISGILHNPGIIIFDEPLSGLDANSVILVKELISRLAREGKTIFYCSHMMDVVEKVSDRIVLISEGTVVADDTFANLQQRMGQQHLEQIFSSLTKHQQPGSSADELLRAFENNNAL